jgi:hypothetical protein
MACEFNEEVTYIEELSRIKLNFSRKLLKNKTLASNGFIYFANGCFSWDLKLLS